MVSTAILDRSLHYAEIISISGKSYRLKDRACKLARRSNNQRQQRADGSRLAGFEVTTTGRFLG